MNRSLPVALVATLSMLAGCMSTSVREYSYDIDVKNATDQGLGLELLQARGSTIRKLRADLAPGGSFSHAYTIRGEAEYLEARVRLLSAADAEPWYIFELPQGLVRADIQAAEGKLRLVPRKRAADPAYQP